MIIQSIRTRVFREGESLLEFITEHLDRLTNNSILVVTSKIAALGERRTAIIKNKRTKETLIRQESQLALFTPGGFWLTVKDNTIMASAGIDESNAQGKLILLPKDSFQTARNLRQQLKRRYGLKNLGILVTDSRITPLRRGVSGVALGYAGFKGLKDYRGQPDIFGRRAKHTVVNVADSLATAAVLLMGEGNERQPLAIIEQPPVKFNERVSRYELLIDLKDDLYRPLLDRLSKTKKI